MTAQRQSAAILACVTLLALFGSPRAYAPIYGFYPGLVPLINQSDVIAVAMILKQLSEEDFGGSARYKIRFEKVLKGNPSYKEVTASLRKLQVDTPTDQQQWQQQQRQHPGYGIRVFGPYEPLESFRSSSRHVLFLVKTKEDKDASYENVNCMGSYFPISPFTDVTTLKEKTAADSVSFLLRDYLEFKRIELKRLEEQVETFLHGGD